MDNYPAGAKYDPRAPWNQPDPPEWELDELCLENGMVVVYLSWYPRNEELPTKIELFADDLYELIERKIH